MAEVQQEQADAGEIGWWIVSADEETYGPVSRESLRTLLQEGGISTNTLVRHCTQLQPAPVADQPGMTEGLQLGDDALPYGDRLGEVWSTKRKQRDLADGSLPCHRHKRPAVLVCVRCHAPYCRRCRMKPFRKQFFFCRKCQASLYNRRVFAFLVDMFLINYLPIILLSVFLIAVLGESMLLFLNLIQFVVVIAFLFRDAALNGAGPGKRLVGLQVVRVKDGSKPLGYGQAVLRWISQAIPFFNLLDFIVPYRDPLTRRFGDRWAGTRVIDRAKAIQRAREKVRKRLSRKGVNLPQVTGMSMKQYAEIGG